MGNAAGQSHCPQEDTEKVEKVNPFLRPNRDQSTGASRPCRLLSYFDLLKACAISKWCFSAGRVLPAQFFSSALSPPLA